VLGNNGPSESNPKSVTLTPITRFHSLVRVKPSHYFGKKNVSHTLLVLSLSIQAQTLTLALALRLAPNLALTLPLTLPLTLALTLKATSA